MRKEPNHAKLSQCSDSLCCNPHHWKPPTWDTPDFVHYEAVMDGDISGVVQDALAGNTFATRLLGFWAWSSADFSEWKPTIRAILKRR